MTPKRVCECRFCGNRYTPQGRYSHEQFCDRNPHYGVPFDRQESLGLEPGASDSNELEGSRDEPEPEGLPPVETIAAEKKPRSARNECPLCGSEALDADEARRSYQEAADQPNRRALKAYQIAEQTCANPACAALWGGEFPEPVPMLAVMTS